jgi:hypothetical protein
VGDHNLFRCQSVRLGEDRRDVEVTRDPTLDREPVEGRVQDLGRHTPERREIRVTMLPLIEIDLRRESSR